MFAFSFLLIINWTTCPVTKTVIAVEQTIAIKICGIDPLSFSTCSIKATPLGTNKNAKLSSSVLDTGVIDSGFNFLLKRSKKRTIIPYTVDGIGRGMTIFNNVPTNNAAKIIKS